jgi:hypothetical protein
MADEAGEEDSTPPATDAPQAEGSHVAKEWEKGPGRTPASQGQGRQVKQVSEARETMLDSRLATRQHMPTDLRTRRGLSTAFAAREASPAPVVLSPLDVIELPVCIAPRTGERAGRRAAAPRANSGNRPRTEFVGRGNAVEAVRSLARPPQLELVRAHALVNLAETG